jgi:hypothetical protein
MEGVQGPKWKLRSDGMGIRKRTDGAPSVSSPHGRAQRRETYPPPPHGRTASRSRAATGAPNGEATLPQGRRPADVAMARLNELAEMPRAPQAVMLAPADAAVDAAITDLPPHVGPDYVLTNGTDSSSKGTNMGGRSPRVVSCVGDRELASDSARGAHHARRGDLRAVSGQGAGTRDAPRPGGDGLLLRADASRAVASGVRNAPARCEAAERRCACGTDQVDGAWAAVIAHPRGVRSSAAALIAPLRSRHVGAASDRWVADPRLEAVAVADHP